MKKIRFLASSVLIGLIVGVLPGTAQYQVPTQANWKDIYCSGFFSEPLPKKLKIVMGEDAVGRVLYSDNDYVYLGQGTNDGIQVGQKYSIVRRVKDPNLIYGFYQKGEVTKFFGQRALMNSMGKLYVDVGRLEVVVVHPTTATAQVTEVCEAPMAGDVLIPFQERPVPEYKPLEAFDRFALPSGKISGYVVVGKDFGHEYGEGDAIYVNLGSRENIKVGDYFGLYRSGSGTRYEGYQHPHKGLRRYPARTHMLNAVPYPNEIPKLRKDLPREALGEALVVHVTEKSSTAVITHSLREIHAGDFAEVLPAAPPRATLGVVPDTIQEGESASLNWQTVYATHAEISPEPGAVGREGSARVSPRRTTTYRLLAEREGATAEATATLTVLPAPPPPPPAPAGPPLDELFAQNVKDIFFEFNKYEIRPEASNQLQIAARFLLEYPEIRVLIEGHCDEIGTVEYNVRLGERRTQVTRDFLVAQGVSPERIETVSVGKARPFCTESIEESCRQLNRRAHFVRIP